EPGLGPSNVRPAEMRAGPAVVGAARSLLDLDATRARAIGSAKNQLTIGLVVAVAQAAICDICGKYSCIRCDLAAVCAVNHTEVEQEAAWSDFADEERAPGRCRRIKYPRPPPQRSTGSSGEIRAESCLQ